MEKPLNVEQFIQQAQPAAMPILTALCAMIYGAFPNAEEKIGYGVPQYKVNSASLGLSVAKKHVTLGFSFGLIPDEVRRKLEEKGYHLGLQTLQIKFGQEIPTAEIQTIFRAIQSSPSAS